MSKYLIVSAALCAASSATFAADRPVTEPTVELNVAPVPGEKTAPAAGIVPAPAPEPPVPDQANVVAFLEHLDLPGWKAVPGFASDTIPDKTAMLQEFGCRTSFSKGFLRGQRRIDVVVYAFSSTQGAYAAYGLLRRGSSTFMPKGDASSEDDQSVSIWKDHYFISVSGTSEDDEESKTAVSTVANQLTKVISGHGQLPLAITKLPGLDRVRGSERVVMGPISARRFFPAPSLNALAFPNGVGGGIADYQFQAPFRERMKLLIVDYGNAEAAARSYEKYIAAIEEQHPNVSPTDIESRGLFKMANSYLLCELRAQRIVLISGARKRSAPIMLARQVY